MIEHIGGTFPSCQYCTETPPKPANGELEGKKICGWCRSKESNRPLGCRKPLEPATNS